jgi:hypothetical protein
VVNVVYMGQYLPNSKIALLCLYFFISCYVLIFGGLGGWMVVGRLDTKICVSLLLELLSVEFVTEILGLCT